VIERSPVFQQSADSYVVQPGDTLYSIAWRFEKDYHQLAHWNGIAPPYRILPGQRIRLRGLSLSESSDSRYRRQVPVQPEQKSQRSGTSAETSAWPPGRWLWPATGSVLRGFGSTGQAGGGRNRGLDIRLQPKTAVKATAPGTVVYAGNGLGGFRHLIILKHDEHYLSAYSLQQNLKVKEGQHIKAGAQLADIVGRGTAAARLHFEIRRDGNPVNPDRFLQTR